jgi:uncharacterized protein YbjT (DUF2867 family)
MKLLLVGATGLVGRHVLELALADERVTQVVAPVRRPLPEHPRLLAPQVDYEQLPEDADWWRADAVICTLGTTMKLAGSREAFRRVDHDYPLQVARLAHRHGTRTYALNSAVGANARSRFFYNRVKGELEAHLGEVGFASLALVRPGLIGGQRADHRWGEGTMLRVLGLLEPLLPRGWRINPAANIAQALLTAALEPRPGVSVVSAAQLAR